MTPSARTFGAGLLVILALAGLAAAFGLSATAGAGTEQTTDPPTTTEPPPPTEPPIEPPPSTPAPIAFGVTVGGVKVGGLMPYQASKAVSKAYARPLVLVVDETRRIELEPDDLGATANVPKAVRRARLARPGALVPLDVEVSQARVRRFVTRLGKSVDRKPVDARIVLTGLKPRAVEAQEGRILKKLATGRAIRTAFATNSRTPIRLAFEVQKPKVETAELDEAVVILRGSNRLLFFDDAKLVRWFGVATGQAAYPTPLGNYEIVNMQRDPWWYPPPSGWAKDSDPVPPGPGNPLGTRWMGISSPYVGIHGTPDAASIGYSASHGCIRMRIPDAEWLFRHVEIGTPVFIVAR
ncbi:MAG TPA: L,D-transpeptidase/peptidoglycan binding protein [Gaiellaceae bacterium]|nr:L,D-transpeptidase/peptidoglycan binding protein [Gaiellaceae bacterium]